MAQTKPLEMVLARKLIQQRLIPLGEVNRQITVFKRMGIQKTQVVVGDPSSDGNSRHPGSQGQPHALAQIDGANRRILPPPPHEVPGIGFTQPPALDHGFSHERRDRFRKKSRSNRMPYGYPPQGRSQTLSLGIPQGLKGTEERNGEYHIPQLPWPADPYFVRSLPPRRKAPRQFFF
jgi:hypothetical protein